MSFRNRYRLFTSKYSCSHERPVDAGPITSEIRNRLLVRAKALYLGLHAILRFLWLTEVPGVWVTRGKDRFSNPVNFNFNMAENCGASVRAEGKGRFRQRIRSTLFSKWIARLILADFGTTRATLFQFRWSIDTRRDFLLRLSRFPCKEITFTCWFEPIRDLCFTTFSAWWRDRSRKASADAWPIPPIPRKPRWSSGNTGPFRESWKVGPPKRSWEIIFSWTKKKRAGKFRIAKRGWRA